MATDPLHHQFPIVDEAGRPTMEFQRKFNAQRDTNTTVTADLAAVTAAAAAAQATADSKPDTFLELSDTPSTYTGQAGKFPKVNVAENGLEFADATAVANFLDLEDTPDTYTGQASKAVQVKADETGLEFVTVGAGTGVQLDRDRYGPPEAADFATLVGTNSEDPTVSDDGANGMVIEFGSSPAAGDNVRCVLKAEPADTDYSIIARLEPIFAAHRFTGAGLALRDSGSGEIVTFTISNQGAPASGPAFKVTRWTNATTFSSDRVAGTLAVDAKWLRIDVISGDATDFYVSQNGTYWIKILSEAQSGFLAFDQVGFALHINRSADVQAVSGTEQMVQSVLYYTDPDIVPTVQYPGVKGETGDTGPGVPVGGSANQALTKIDGTDYNTQWSTIDKTWVGLGNVTNDAQLKRSAADWAGFSAKATPVDADEFLIEDSEDSYAKKRSLWSAVKATLKTYFDGLYLEISQNLADLADAATARTNLGLAAGGAGDIWVEKAGDTMTGALLLPVGSVSAPALQLGASTRGLYKNDLAGSGVGSANDINATQSINLYQPTAGADFRTYCGGAAQFRLDASRTANGGNPIGFITVRSRGDDWTAKTAVIQNSITGMWTTQGYDGAANQAVSEEVFSVAAATPSSTDMQGRWRLLLSPAGSVTPTELFRGDYDLGLSMYGANVVIDQNRHHALRSYTTAGLPSVPTAGRMLYTSDLGDGALTFSNGSAFQHVAAGTYTPTLTGVTNVNALVASVCQYMRVGRVVTVSGKFNVDATAAGVVELGISLPFASNFAADQQCSGSAVLKSSTFGASVWHIYGDTTNDRAHVRSDLAGAVDLNANDYMFQFTYLIV